MKEAVLSVTNCLLEENTTLFNGRKQNRLSTILQSQCTASNKKQIVYEGNKKMTP